ncbi:MAG: hypothetical protein JWP36_598, partial [Paucimonas sp.]|nr:hypothetical protein [Paucimonas sp.]
MNDLTNPALLQKRHLRQVRITKVEAISL